MSEPTIYKPSIYNGPTIYNGNKSVYNGNGVYNDGADNGLEYYSDFTNFDTTTKIDTPIKGPKTNYYSNNISYVYENDYLKATSIVSSNSDTVGLSFVKQNGTVLESEFVISHPNSSPPSFIWCSNFGFDNDCARTNFEFLVLTSKNYTLFNGTYKNRTDSGFNWFSFPETAGINFFKVTVKYDDITEIYINDILSIKINSLVDDSQIFKIRPMKINQFIKMKYLHITNAISFDGGVI